MTRATLFLLLLTSVDLFAQIRPIDSLNNLIAAGNYTKAVEYSERVIVGGGDNDFFFVLTYAQLYSESNPAKTIEILQGIDTTQISKAAMFDYHLAIAVAYIDRNDSLRQEALKIFSLNKTKDPRTRNDLLKQKLIFLEAQAA